MATDIVNLEFGQTLSALPNDPKRGVYVVVWKGDIPLGAKMLKPGQNKSELESWIAGLTASDDRTKMPNESLPLITVAICTRDRPAAVRNCLKAVRNQSYGKFNILVVDNGEPSRSSLVELCEEYQADYTIETRPGVVHARNRAVATASGELIAFIDDDCTPVPGWLRHAAEEFVRRPNAACCTGPILPCELETPAQELMEFRGGFSRGFERHVYTEHSGKATMPTYPLQAWLFGSGGNMILRRRSLRQLGGFDEFMDIGEDLDIFYRILREGHTLVYSPGAVVMHSHLREHHSLRRRLYRWGTAYITFLAKVAMTDSTYRAIALREMCNWFGFQLGHRSTEMNSGFPADLYAAELLGGLSGASASWFRYGYHLARTSNKVQKLQDTIRR